MTIGKNQQWMLKLVDGSMRNKVFASSQNVSPNKLLITKTKNNFIVEKPGMYHLNHMVKVGSTSNKHLYHAPLI